MTTCVPGVLLLFLHFGQPAQAPSDTSGLGRLIDGLRDSSEVARNAAVGALRRRAPQLLPALEAMLRDNVARRSMGAAMALVEIGLPALPSIRRSLADTNTTFEIREALQSVPQTDSAALTLLGPLLSDGSPIVRRAAVEAVNPYREGGGSLGRALVRALGDSDPGVRASAAYELIQIDDSASRHAAALIMTALLEDRNREVRRSMVYSLGNMGDVAAPAVPGIIRRLQQDPDSEVRWLSARVLGWLGPGASQAVPALVAHLNDPMPQVRAEALTALGGIGVSRVPAGLGDSVIAVLRAHLSARDSTTRLAAVEALAEIGTRAVPALAAALRSPDEQVAVTAAAGLGALPDDPAIVDPLLHGLGDARPSVARASADALGGIGATVVSRLRALTRSSISGFRAAASRALHVHEVATSLPVARHCYRVEYGPWKPPLPSESIEGILPPRTLRFSTVRVRQWREADSLAFLVEQEHKGTWYRSGYWVPRVAQRTLDIDPSPSLSGVRMTLRVHDEKELRGSITTYWDFTSDTETATVVAHLISCTAP